jgi:hypothetical protein
MTHKEAVTILNRIYGTDAYTYNAGLSIEAIKLAVLLSKVRL